MNSRLIVIRWNEPDVRGWSDLIWERRIEHSPGGSPSFFHRVRGRRGGEHLAQCRLRIKGSITDLDYIAHATFNKAHGMDLGVMRLVFGDSSRRSLQSVLWKDPADRAFRPVDVTISYEKARAGALEDLYEGAVRRISRASFIRNARARRLCIEAHGPECAICGFDFGRIYGRMADGFIHVHHIKSLSARRKRHAVDPVTDLRPLCANCHVAVHLRNPAFSLDDVRKLMAKAAAGEPGGIG